MKKYCIVFILSTVIVFPTTVFSQYLPVGLMPMEYNSSFAGSAGNSRIYSNTYYRPLSEEYSKGSQFGFYASYDKFLPKLRSGIGFKTSGITSSYSGSYYYSDAKSKLRVFNFSAIIAPKISIKGKYTISPSLELGYNNNLFQFNYFQFIYDDQIGERIQGEHIQNRFSSRASILFNASNYYLGYMVRIYQSKRSYYSDSDDFDFYSAFQFGYSFQKSIVSKFSFTPQLVFPLVANSNSIEWYWPAYNLSFRYEHLIIGAINQFNIAYPIGFQLGWQKNGWRILLSNQFKDPYTNETNKVDYTANFSLRYIFNQDKKSIHILNAY